jgi:polyferredoxin/NAD-dependent dihydropyrimidine dehydrogenase PreA subunit
LRKNSLEFISSTPKLRIHAAIQYVSECLQTASIDKLLMISYAERFSVNLMVYEGNSNRSRKKGSPMQIVKSLKALRFGRGRVNSKRLLRLAIQLSAAAGLTLLWLIQRPAYSSTTAYTRANSYNPPNPIYTLAGFLDPLTGLAALIHRQWVLWVFLSIASLAVAALWGRLFCGWLCPVGALLDFTGYAKRLFRLRDFRPGHRLMNILEFGRWLVFGACLGLAVFGSAYALFLDPFVLWSRELKQLAGSALPWSLVLLVVLGIISFPRVWCRLLCPAGSLFGLVHRIRGAQRTADANCNHCRVCSKRCSMMNISADIRFGTDCLGCDDCRFACPRKSIAGKSPEAAIPRTSPRLERRQFLQTLGAGAASLAFGGFFRHLPSGIPGTVPPDEGFLRPPGALSEDAFLSACSRCGQCVSVCPTQVLSPVGPDMGLAMLDTPRFVTSKKYWRYCTLCGACDRACPTGALASVPKPQMRMGTAVIDPAKCFGWLDGGGVCYLNTCPSKAVYFDEPHRPYIDEDKCVGCGYCVWMCPGYAVKVVSRGEIRRTPVI